MSLNNVKIYNIHKLLYFQRKSDLDFINRLYKEEEKYGDSFIKEYQIKSFNKIWLNATNRFIFYKNYLNKYNLPKEISKIEDLFYFPAITKSDIQNNLPLILKDLNEKSKIIRTGGSSGEPASYPLSKRDNIKIWASLRHARVAFNTNNCDSTILIWGSANRFKEEFLIGKIKSDSIRIIKDIILGQIRILAYDVSDEAIEKTIEIINQRRNSLLIGYASYIVRIAKFLKNNSIILNNNQVTKIILTAESIYDDEIKLIEDIFRCDCILEYGASEIGCISYASWTRDNKYKVLWENNLVINKSGKVVISTINRLDFPLINYELGDLFNINTNDALNNNSHILDHGLVKGRNNDIISVICYDKIKKIHSETFTHILRSDLNINDFYIIQDVHNIINIFVNSKDFNNTKIIFINNIVRLLPDIDITQFNFKKFDGRKFNKIGKSKWITSLND